MEDWDVRLEYAADAARATAEQPLVCAALEALGSGAELVPTFSEEAMVDLLDIAILTGDREAARHCAKQSKLRPLRRWSGRDLFHAVSGDCGGFYLFQNLWIELRSWRLEVQDTAMLLASLLAGVEVPGLKSGLCRVPLRESVVISVAPWVDFAELLPLPESLWVAEKKNFLGKFFIKIDEDTELASLDKEKLERAKTAGISFQNFDVETLSTAWCFLSVLDLAILFGQSDCAALCATMGAKLSKKGRHMLAQHLNADPARCSAAKAAAHEMLTASWKSEISTKAIVIYQLMKKLARGKHFPILLVNDIVSFSMAEPEIVGQLDLWEEAHVFCQSAHLRQAMPSAG